MKRIGCSAGVVTLAALVGVSQCGGASSPSPIEDGQDATVPPDGVAPLPPAVTMTSGDTAAKADVGSAPDTARADAKRADARPLPDAPLADDSFFGASRCKSSQPFCEDFETGTLDSAKWGQWGGQFSVESTRAARGRYALHARIGNAASSGGMITVKMPTALAGHSVFIRLFGFVDGELPNTHHRLVRMLGTPPDGKGELGYELANYGGEVPTMPNEWAFWGYDPKVRADGEYAFGKEAKERGLGQMPVGQWVCWELEMVGAPASSVDALAFYVNDQKVPSMSVKATEKWTAPQTSQIEFGMYISHPDPEHPQGFNLWYDEIAIGDQKIGCRD